MQTVFSWLVTIVSALIVAAGCTASVQGQTAIGIEGQRSSFGRVDSCAGRGAIGSPSYGACQLQQRTLRLSVDRAPDLSGLDRTARLRIEQACLSGRPRGDAVYTSCLRQQLVLRGSDPATPIRPIPETQRKPKSPYSRKDVSSE